MRHLQAGRLRSSHRRLTLTFNCMPSGEPVRRDDKLKRLGHIVENERSPVGTRIINLARPRQPYFNQLASPSDYVVLVDVPCGPNQALFDKHQFVVKPINTDSEVCATTSVSDRGAAP